MDGAHAPRRLAGAAAVLLLHLVIVAAFLSGTRLHLREEVATPEIVLHFLQPLAHPVANKFAKPNKAGLVRKSPPSSVVPDYALPETLHSISPTNAGQPLFACDPAQMTTATPEQRAACASASLAPRYDAGAVDYRDHTDRSKSAAQWARGRARKNSAFLLPCMSPDGFSPLYTAYCLGKTAATGKFDSESQPGYEDMPEHAANEGDTRLAPAPH